MRNNAKESGPEWNEETVLKSNLSEKKYRDWYEYFHL